MDIAKTLFVTVGTAGILGGVFGAGLYSAHTDNGIYNGVYGVYDQIKTLYKELPNLRKTEPIHFLRKARYEGSGITVNAIPEGGEELVLLSGFFEDDNGVRLIERDGTLINEWDLRIHELMPDVSACRNPPATDWNAIPHGTLITPEGDIIFGFESCGMVRLDRCGNKKWETTPTITHHSPGFRSGGGFVFMGGEFVDKTGPQVEWPFDGPYWEDTVIKLTEEGEVDFRQPMTRILKDGGFAPIITAGSGFRTKVDGEFHLNDVNELPPELAAAFPMFEAGDMVMSLRNMNMILVTNADATEVKWSRIGPWIRQHDPDFNPDGTITLFDNHSDESLDGDREGGSRIWSVDPATDEATVLYGGTPEQHMYSPERSTHQVLSNGNIMITEAQSGRSFEVDRAGNILWEYINRYDPFSITWMHDASAYHRDYFTVTDWSCG